MEYWIARDKNGNLFIYKDCPNRCKLSGHFRTIGEYFHISCHLFPEVTFENSPQKVKLELIEE